MRLARQPKGETPDRSLERLNRDVGLSESSATSRRFFRGTRLPEASESFLASLILLGLGLLFLWSFFPSAYLPWSPLTASTEGTVVSMGTDVFGDAEMCDPEVEYVVGGRTYTAHPSSSADPCPWHVGGPADVRYNPDVPITGEVEMGGPWMWFTIALPLACLGGGLYFLLVALLASVAALVREPPWASTRRARASAHSAEARDAVERVSPVNVVMGVIPGSSSRRDVDRRDNQKR